MYNKLVLVGGGGHCKSIIDVLQEYNLNIDIVIIDVLENVGKSIMGVPIVGVDEDFKKKYDEGYTHAFVSLGSIGNCTKRKILYNHLKKLGFKIPVIKASSSVVSKNAIIEEGVFIGKNAIVNTEAHISNCSIINTGCIIEHECNIGAFAHIGPGAVLSGNVQVGMGTHIGANTVVRQNIAIGEDCLIGIGSVVTNDIKNGVTAYGNPCKGVE